MYILGVRISYSKWPKIHFLMVTLRTFWGVVTLRHRILSIGTCQLRQNKKITNRFFPSRQFIFYEFRSGKWCFSQKSWKSMKNHENQRKSRIFMISVKNTIFPIEIRKTKIVGTEKNRFVNFLFWRNWHVPMLKTRCRSVTTPQKLRNVTIKKWIFGNLL